MPREDDVTADWGWKVRTMNGSSEDLVMGGSTTWTGRADAIAGSSPGQMKAVYAFMQGLSAEQRRAGVRKHMVSAPDEVCVD